MTRHSFEDLPLAIIGMACRLPGAENLDQYWHLLRDGASAVAELPPDRLDQALYYHPEMGVPGKSYTKLGGVVPERPFDRDLCPISDGLIASSDIVHLSMLEVAATACHHAGLDPLAMPLRNTGVFIGHARGSSLAGDIAYSTHIEASVQYLQRVDPFTRLSPDLRNRIVHDIVERVHHQQPHRVVGRNPDVASNAVAGLISEAFGLTGPYMAVDAACASSLFAMASAAKALHHGQIDMAIVGGASYSNWYSLVIFSQAQALSSTGSFPFDSRADGFISSDGYAAVLVKTLPRALADGDWIYGVIRGIGISCDGRGKSLWAPRKEGQIEAIHRAYGHGLDPARLQYIEAHGTSTQLGDATEVDALATALGDCFPRGTKIPIASVKANIGHTRETAGLAGLIKTLLAMQHGTIPPAANFETPNPQIGWDKVPFFVPTSEIEWPALVGDHPRRAAIDAFGIGGLNVHLVVDDFPTDTRNVVFSPGKLPEPAHVHSEVHDDAVAIIGQGAIFPGARTIAAYWDLLVTGRDPKSNVPMDRWNADIFLKPGSFSPWRTPTGLGGFITDFAYDWKKHRIPPKQLETADPLQFLLLDATDQALRDAGYESKTFDRRRTGVVVGTCFGDDFARQLNRALRLPEFQQTLAQVLREHGVPEESTRQVCEAFAKVFVWHHQVIHDETGSYTSSTLASRIAKTFDLMGGAFAVDAGEASSLAALGAGVDLLLSGACNVVLCAGAQRTMDVSLYEWYASRGLLSPDRPRAGFDSSANGFVPGEGVGMVLLKRLRDARRDGDPICAIIRGLAAATDAKSPGAAVRLAIERALASSRIDPGDVAVVEAAGIGEPHIDAEEADALANVYGSGSRKHPLLLGSLVGQIGHTQGASGMASLLKLTLALQHGQMPASVGLAKPANPVADRMSVLRTLPESLPIPVTSDKGRHLAGVSAFALRGLAYHVLLERPLELPAPRAADPADWRIVRVGAGTVAELLEQVARRQEHAESLFITAPMGGFTPGDRVRLAIVADGPDSLARKLRLASEQIANSNARPALEEQGIFYREVGQEPPRVAFLFSGQGSQYLGMLRELANEVSAAAAMLKEIDGTMSRLGYPTFAEIAWESASDIGRDVWRTQVAVLLADTIVQAALTSLGIRPDVISAHSYGEYPALVAAGAWTMEQAIRITRARCDAIEASEQARGVMLSTTAPPEVVERLTAGIEGTICVANHNAPDQTVVGGQQEAVSELQSRLASEGFENQLLPVPRPFHTPLMADVKEAMRQILQAERILPPRIPLLSSITNRYIADPLDIRAHLVEQLTSPVRYVDLITRLADEGVTVFVEVGPRQVLTRLHRRILAERDAAIIACDNPKRPGIEQLCRVQALLECAGVLIGHTKTDDTRQTESTAIVPGKPGVKREIVHFDATARRRQRMRRLPELVSDTTSRRRTAPTEESGDELESFLINFVCEQTGYPPEVVELDADLEADLGIDSIKKAQLFGELREHFDLKPVDRLSLDDFPTLRHVLDFLRQSGCSPRQAAGGTTPVSTQAPGPPASDGAQPARVAAAAVARVADPTADDSVDAPMSILNIVRVAGTPYEMGLQHARNQTDQIKNILGRYRDLLKGQLGNMEELPHVFAQADAFFTPAGLEEFRGMETGLDLPLESLIAYNLGLYPDHAAGCTQFAITARRNGGGMIHGVNEDAPLSLSLADCLTRIVQVRHPAAGIPHMIFTASGQLGGVNGVNARGLAVSSTLLLDRPRRAVGAIGIMHPILVMTILERAEDIESALKIVRGTERMGAFSLTISDNLTDRLCYLEYDGASLHVQHDKDLVMTTNHCLLHVSREVPQHSSYRLTRLRNLLGENGRFGFTVGQAQAALRDRYDLGRGRVTPHPTMNTIHRIDNQVSIVMRPASGEVWATPGPLSKEKADLYCSLNLKELFASEAPLTHRVHDRRTVAYRLDAPAAPPESDTQPDERGRIMSRFVLRVADVSLNDRSERTPNFHGPVLIMGQNPTALALRERLEESGATVMDLPVCDDPEETLAALDHLWQAHPTPHLFLMTARDEDAAPGDDEEAWVRRRARGVMLPYLVCQRWTRLVSQSNLLDKATLVAATAMGGDFGFSGRVTAVEGGALAGLLKSIRREFEGMLVKVVDTPPEESPKQVVAGLWTELTAGTPEVEVGYVRGRRRLVRAVPRSPELLEQRGIPRGGTWVVTGGARGITGFVARELGRRFGLELHLIGTIPPPQPDAVWRNLSAHNLKELKMTITKEARRTGRDPLAAWRQVERAIELDKTLREFAEEGVRATYHDCDVSDRKALGRVLERIRRSAGPIHGIIHGAGVEAAARFDRKQLDSVTATIAAKVDGAAALMALTREDPLQYFVGFGSISGRFGGHGQTDYSLASDMLCKLIGRFRAERPTCASVAFHWPPWGELGMAVRPETKVVLALAQQRFMPPLEGVEHLIGELRAGAPEAEVLLIDRPSRLDLDKTAPTPIQLQAYRQRRELISRAPLIDGVYELHEGHSLVAEARFDPTQDRFLIEHRHQGVPILPAVIGIELFAEAASILFPGRTVVGLRNFDVINGFRFFSDRPQGARIRATLADDGIQCVLNADFHNREGRLTDPDRVYLKGVVELADKPTAIVLPHPGEPGNWNAMKYLDPQQAIQGGRIYLGAPLQCLRDVAFERGGCWGRIVAPPFAELAGLRRGGGWVVPSAALDGCFQTAGAFMYKAYGTLQLPLAAERLRFGRLPRDGETCIGRVTMRDRQATHTDFDFALFGEDGTVILSAKGYRCIVVTRKAN